MADTPTSCDVLVLGSGLAGLRAAVAAAETVPSARVLVAAPHSGPHGSSFANKNARIGMLTPDTDAAREAFAARAMALAAPGTADRSLVDVLAAESAARARELAAMGAPMDRAADSTAARHSSCFLRGVASALVFTDLPALHRLLVARARAHRVGFASGFTAHRVLTAADGAACGALFTARDGTEHAVRARSVLVATGGPAALFARSMGGPGVPGTSFALLARAGAELANAGFVQFFWCRLDDGTFFHVHRLAEPGAATASPGGGEAPLPPAAACHAAERSTHCPLSWGQADRALDKALLTRLDEDGALSVRLASGERTRIAPFAHSGNGGARVDQEGRSTVPGLFAVGECATGMHGADRVGGAMAAATQVFGARAGAAAAPHAVATASVPAKTFSELTKIHTAPLPAHAAHHGPDAAPFPPQSLRMLAESNFYLSDFIVDSIEGMLASPCAPVREAALFSALTVVRNLHTIT